MVVCFKFDKRVDLAQDQISQCYPFLVNSGYQIVPIVLQVYLKFCSAFTLRDPISRIDKYVLLKHCTNIRLNSLSFCLFLNLGFIILHYLVNSVPSSNFMLIFCHFFQDILNGLHFFA